MQFFRAPFPLSKKMDAILFPPNSQGGSRIVPFWCKLLETIPGSTSSPKFTIHPSTAHHLDRNPGIPVNGDMKMCDGKKNTTKNNPKTGWKTPKSTPKKCCVQLNAPNKKKTTKTTNSTHLQLPWNSFLPSMRAKSTPPRRAWTKAAPKRSNSLRSPPKATTVRMANKHSLGEGWWKVRMCQTTVKSDVPFFGQFLGKFYQGFYRRRSGWKKMR